MSVPNDIENFDWGKLKEHEFEFDEAAWQDMESRINATESPFNFLQNIQAFLTLATVFYFLVVLALVYHVTSKSTDNQIITNKGITQQINTALWLPFLESNINQAPNSPYLWNLTASNTYFGEDLPVLLAGDAKATAPRAATLSERLQNYDAFTNPDKVYLHIDRTLYRPGDDIWFKAYVRDAGTLRASNMSEMLYVELINPAGKVLHKRKLTALDGQAKGDFRIGEEMSGGIYKIKAYTNWQRNFEDYFEREIQVQKPVIPKLAMQLEFERKAYGAGDEVTANLRLETPDNQPLKENSFEYKINIDGKEILKKSATTDAEGKSNVKFILPDELETADGLLNVIVDYKGTKESIARAVPIVLNKIDMQFFPEGGELIGDIPVRVAFKALNEFGKSADVEGVIVNSNNEKVLAFQSYHQGMGAVEFTPEFEDTYTAKITKPRNITQTFKLPVVNGTGFALKIDNRKKSSLDVGVVSTQEAKLMLIVQSRGQIWLEKKIKVKSGITPVTISTAKFPTGIAQITLLTQNEVELAERLVFLNKHKQLNVSINTDKKQYLPREKVEMTIKVKDENGRPAPGNFSLSVVDNNLLSFADDKQANILAHTLLSSEIKGNIEEPNFYFEKDNAKADEALDLLMMTQGWRKFEWKKINIAPDIAVKYRNEKATLAGVLRGENSQTLANASIRISGTTLRQRTDENGKFRFENVDISKGAHFQIQAEGYPENWARVRQHSEALSFLLSKQSAKVADMSNYGGRYNSTRVEAIPARYEIVTEQYEIQPASSQMVATEPVFEKVMDSILVKPATATEAAQYQLFIKDVLIEKAAYEEVEIPAEYGTTERKVLKTPATTREVAIPAQYSTITKRVLVGNEYRTVTETVYTQTGNTKLSEKKTWTETLESTAVTFAWETPQNNLSLPEFKGKLSATGVSVKDIQDLENRNVANYKMYYLQEVEAAKEEEVKIPAKYVTKEKRLLVEAPKMEKVEVAAQFIEVETWVKNEHGDYEIKMEQREVVPPHFMYHITPAKFDTIQEQVKISSPGEQLKLTPPKYEVQSKTITKSAEEGFTMNGFYRARSFYANKYDKPRKSDKRTDFRPTIYWNTNVNIGNSGTKTLTFYNSDATTTFRTALEGFSDKGDIAHATHKHHTQMPLSMDVKIPSNILLGDKVSIPLTISNNSGDDVRGKLKISAPKNFKLLEEIPQEQTIITGNAKTILLEYEATSTADGTFKIRFDGGEFKDEFEANIKTAKRGFPKEAMYSGADMAQDFEVEINEPIKNSLEAHLTIYPDILGEVMTGLDRMLRQPHGCFEQVSSSNYPNILVLNYLLENNIINNDIEKTANRYLAEGYKKLIGYEVEGGGFDWYGRTPAHEGLTAYGLMQFKDMKAVYSVDDEMIKHNAEWLLGRKDGEGTWNINPKHLHSWGESDVMYAYINWALAEAGYGGKIQEEINTSYEKGLTEKDPYTIALLANTLYLTNDARYENTVGELIKLQETNGSWKGTSHSAMYSKGSNLEVETTALAMLALMRSDQFKSELGRAAKYLTAAKTPHGFGSTQATVLGMKALTTYAKTINKEARDGSISMFVNDKKILTKKYEVDSSQPIMLRGIEKYMQSGKQKVSIKFEDTETALPFDISVNYTTKNPPNHPAAKVELKTQIADTSISTGETVRLTATLTNTADNSLPNTIALIGIPAGLSVQAWQLKDLRDKEIFDYYEIWDGYLVLHYRDLEANETQTIPLDLKADIAGIYESPASCVYMYYTNEVKHWAAPSKIIIQ